MATQVYGNFTALDPVVEVDGEQYSAALQFNQGPLGATSKNNIVNGTIADVEDLGGGYHKITCKRDFQSDSYFVSKLNGGPYERVYQVYAGGNICRPSEPERIFNFSSSSALRGDLSLTRATEGDVCVIDGKSFLITSAKAFDVAPDEVDYTGGEYFPITSYFVIDFQNVELTPPDTTVNKYAEIFFEPNQLSGAFQDSNVYCISGTSTLLKRKIYNHPSLGTPDEDYYPPSATLNEDEYWYDRFQYYFVFSTSLQNIGDDLYIVYYLKNLDRIEESTEAIKVVESTSDYAGYSGTEDELSHLGFTTRSDFSYAPFIFKYDGHFGQGFLEWRKENTSDSQVLGVTWDTSGYITQVYKRDVKGDPIQTISFTPNASAFDGSLFINLYIEKVGGLFTISYSDDSTSKTQVVQTALTDVEVESSGIVGIGSFTEDYPVKFIHNTSGGVFNKIELGGAQSTVYQFQSEEFADLEFTSDYELPSTNSIQSITIDSHNQNYPMTENGSPARNHYVRNGNTLTFFSESNIDRIKVVQEANTGTPSGPGRCPVASIRGTENFATVADSQDPDATASTNVNENVLNWQDSLTVYDEANELSFSAGENFQVHRNPVFYALDPPDIYYDVVDDDQSDWTLISEDDYEARWTEGIVLIKKSLMDTLSGNLCFKAEGKRFRSDGNCPARIYNDICKSLNSFDEYWTDATPQGGAQDEIGGIVRLGGLVPASFSCDIVTQTPTIDSLALGLTRLQFQRFADAIAQGGIDDREFPFADTSTGGLGYGVVGFNQDIYPDYTKEQNDIPLTCHGTDYEIYQDAQGGTMYEVFPYGRVPSYISTDFNYYGTEGIGGDINLLPSYGNTAFYAKGVPFNIPTIMTRMPEGTQILEGHAEVKFNGYERYEWDLDIQGYTPRFSPNFQGPPAATTAVYREQGQVVTSYTSEPYELIINPRPDRDTSGEVTFILFGKRQNTQNIYFQATENWNLTPHQPSPTPAQIEAAENFARSTIQDAEWRSFGSGVSTSQVEDGKWSLVDVTGAMRALLSAKDSVYSEFCLFPTENVDIESEEDALAGYVNGLTPTRSASSSIYDRYWLEYEHTASGFFVRYDSLQVKNVIVKYRLPSGVVNKFNFPSICGPLS